VRRDDSGPQVERAFVASDLADVPEVGGQVTERLLSLVEGPW
jgi:hypothetical protein